MIEPHPSDRPRGGVLPPARRIRVGAICPMLYHGGAEQATLEMLRCLDGRRFEILGTVATSERDYSEEVAREYRALAPVGFGPGDAAALASGCDVILCWAVEIGRFLPRRGGRPAVVMVSHSTADMQWGITIQRAAAPDVDLFVAVSEAALSSIPPGRRDSSLVIPHAIDPARVRTTRRRAEVLGSWGVDPGRTVIGYVGRLAEEKRTVLFPDVIAHLPAAFVGVMVGVGWDERAVKARAAAMAPGRVYFPGAMSDVGNALGAFSRFLHLAAYESFCLAVAEAMLAEVPVISTSVGFLKDHDGIARIIPFRATAAEIAKTILRDVGDGTGAAARASAAKRLVGRTYGAEAFRESWNRALISAAGIPRRRATYGDTPDHHSSRPGPATPSARSGREFTTHAEDDATGYTRVSASLPCVFRGAEAAEGPLFSCSNPNVHSSGGLVSGEICLACTRRLPIPDERGIFEPPSNGLGSQITDWAVGVIAAAEGGWEIGRQLASLRAAGWDRPRLFAESGIVIPRAFRDLPLTLHDPPLGRFAGWFLGLSELVMREPHADAFLLCGADVLLPPGLRGYLASGLWPAQEVGVVSLASLGPPGPGEAPGFVARGRQHGFSGDSAYVFPNRSARTLISDRLLIDHPWQRADGHPEAIDLVVANWSARAGLPYFFHNPGLVKRIPTPASRTTSSISSAAVGRPNHGPQRPRTECMP